MSLPDSTPNLLNPAELPHIVIGAALEVHSELGPDLPREAYCECLALQLRDMEIYFRHDVSLPVRFKNHRVKDMVFVDFIIEKRLVVQIHAVHEWTPLHKRQMFNYLRMTGLPESLLLNFSAPDLRKNGVKRLFLNAAGE